MRKVWVIVANSTVAKIYRTDDGKTLTLHRKFEHEEGHLRGQDIVSDRMGSNTQRGYAGSDSMQEHTPLKLKEADQFAYEICKFVEEAHKKNEFEYLYLVAKAPFLSNIRHTLSDNVSKLVKEEIHKDLILMRPEEIRDYLPPVL